MRFFRASNASLFAFSLAFAAACSSSSNGSSPGTGTGSDGGTTADGGGNSDGGGGGGGTCTTAQQPTIVADPFVGLSPSLAGADIYYIDPTQGPDTGGGILTGVISHIKTDGTGGATIFTPTRPIFAATVQGTSIYYFQLEADSGSGSAMHLYSIPRAGGTATQVSTYDFSAVNLETTIDSPTAEYRIGIFATQGTDLFMDEETAISRISMTDGTRTVIADGTSTPIFYPALLGSNIVYTAVDSATGGNDLYTVPMSATTASGTKVGTQTCGSTTAQWASPWTGGWICGRVFGLDAVDATGANKTSFYDTKPTDSFYNPSPIDGTTFYAFGSGSGSPNPVRPLLKMDTGTPNAGTNVLCLDGNGVWNARVSTSDLIWEQFESASSAVRTLRRIAR